MKNKNSIVKPDFFFNSHYDIFPSHFMLWSLCSKGYDTRIQMDRTKLLLSFIHEKDVYLNIEFPEYICVHAHLFHFVNERAQFLFGGSWDVHAMKKKFNLDLPCFFYKTYFTCFTAVFSFPIHFSNWIGLKQHFFTIVVFKFSVVSFV